MLSGLSHAFQQHEFADVDVVLLAPQLGKAAAPAARDSTGSVALELRRLPGHLLVLSTSPYFKAQALRWQQQQQDDDGDEPSSKQHKVTAGDVSSGKSASTSRSARPTVRLTLADAGEEPAAMAVLAAMYDAGQLQQGLSQKQQLQAAIIADMLQLPDLTSNIVKGLVAAAGSSAGLTEEVTQAYLHLPWLPSWLLPLLGGVLTAALKWPRQFSRAVVDAHLLSVLGNLEAVWADEQLQMVLLGLPLPLMEALLSSDELQVVSEDTVLYTAQTYTNKQADAGQQQAAKEALAPLIRCPHLSTSWITAMVLSPSAESQLLSACIPQIKQLQAVTAVDVYDELDDDEILSVIPNRPPSWLRPRRQPATVPGGGVSMQWSLPVAVLEAACRQTAKDHKAVTLYSPTQTPPMGGLAWQLFVQTTWNAATGVSVRACVNPVSAPASTFYKVNSVISTPSSSYSISTRAIAVGNGYGWQFFSAGVKSGGWDAAAWCAKNLPTSGELLLKLKVTSVNNAGA